ncbi:MAG: Glycosyltransferase involved in cell wall bisynthesis [Candidatus Electronema aureum]|uniref:Glycosyltransferase involved in cell wall bisynthesis n=1 Tax=Candidatus Electronema aureum TaxID=2005002 RepID=A0A521G0A0_9BACT|nr:MAG: Glycosyltransferase involved in cell wall bisynthesis [Candidatus Electronema aureum]
MISDTTETFRILTCYYRPKPGGFCKRLFRGIRALLDRGHTVHYLAVVPFPIEHPNCHFHRFPWPEERTSGYLFWGCFHLLAPPMLLWLGFRYRTDRAFAFGHTYSLFLQPLRLLKRVPLTLFLRGDTLAKHRTTGRTELLVAIERFLEGLAIAGTRLQSVSEVLLNRVTARHSLLLPAECGILRNDIPQCPALPQKRELPLRAACVGMLEHGKNQQLLLDVFKEIKAEQAQLYLYGTGPDEQLLRERVQRENMTDRVHFMGWVPSERIWPEVDLLLMPSLHEGAPNAVLEALGYGVPVLASDIPEHGEILPAKCLLPLGNATGWRKWVTFSTNEPDYRLRELIREQEAIADRLRFDWDEAFVRCVP